MSIPAIQPTLNSHFGRGSDGLKASGLVSLAPWYLKIPGKILLRKESVTGASTTAFWQDTGSVWAPKALAFRSWTDFAEMSFLEFVESGFFYFSAPILGQQIFQRLFFNPKHGFKKSKIATPFKALAQEVADKKLSPEAFRKILTVKAALIIASASITAIVGNFILNHTKNLLTLKAFGKSQFSDVLGYTQGTEAERKAQNEKVARKAKRRITQSLLAGAALLAGTLLLARKGPSYFAKNPSKWLETLVKHADFKFTEAGEFGLSSLQKFFIIWVAVAGYIDAARDKLELKEVLSRVVLVVAPYLSIGSEVLNKIMTHRVADRTPKLFVEGEKSDWLRRQEARFPGVFKHWNKQIKTLEQITAEAAEAVQKSWAQANPGKTLNPSELQKLTYQHPIFRQALPKLLTFNLIPLAISIFGIGMATAFLNRYWTQRRFEAAQTEAQTQTKSQPQNKQPVPAARPALQTQPTWTAPTGILAALPPAQNLYYQAAPASRAVNPFFIPAPQTSFSQYGGSSSTQAVLGRPVWQPQATLPV